MFFLLLLLLFFIFKGILLSLYLLCCCIVLPSGVIKNNKLCGRPQYAPAPVTLTFDLLTLKVMSESRVTWATSVQL